VSLCKTAAFLNATLCPGNVPAQPAWPDRDQDGFGDKTADATFVCTLNGTESNNNLDCNDNDPTIFPGSYVCRSLDQADLQVRGFACANLRVHFYPMREIVGRLR